MEKFTEKGDGMNYETEYEEFIKWVTDPAKRGIAGPIICTLSKGSLK